MKLLVAIPCLNEANSIEKVIKSIPKKIKGIDVIEILVVDDGSEDETDSLARNAGATVIKHTQNQGVGCAFQTAMAYASEHNVDIMVNMDGDGQFDPTDIEKLIQPILNKEADVVTASRFIDSNMIPDMPKVKLWGNIGMASIISHLCKHKYYDVSCGFRAYSKDTILRSNFHGKFTYTQEAFIFYTSQNLKIMEVPVPVRYFKDRKSRVAGNLFRYSKKTMGIILSLYRDYFPMRMMGSIAGFFLILTLIFGTIFFGHYLITGFFRDFLFAGLTAAFTFLTALAFLCCGISLQGAVRIQENQNRILYLLKKGNPNEK